MYSTYSVVICLNLRYKERAGEYGEGRGRCAWKLCPDMRLRYLDLITGKTSS